MKNKLFFLIFISSVFYSFGQEQFVSVLSGINNTNFSNCVRECGTNYYISLESYSAALNQTSKNIYKIDNEGRKKDSLNFTEINGSKTISPCYINNDKSHLCISTTLADNNHNFLYAAIFDTSFFILNEKIIDTLVSNEFLLRHITIKSKKHIFLTGSYNNSNYMWSYFVYETDTNFNLIKKLNTGFSDGGLEICAMNGASIVENYIDSGYIVTTYNWIIKIDKNLTSLDTISLNNHVFPYQTFNNSLFYNDSLYFENVNYSVFVPPSNLKDFTKIVLKNHNSQVKDSLLFITPYNDNRVTQYHDFLSFINPDTLYYCFIADYDSYNNYVALVKAGPGGQIFWQKYIGGSSNFLNPSVSATTDGGAIIQCMFMNNFDNRQDVLVVKTDKYGNAPVGINENSLVNEKQVLVYPNPAGDFINFETGFYNDLKLEIYNSTGQLLMAQNLKQGKNQISISKLPGGACFYRILYGNIKLENGTFLKL